MCIINIKGRINSMFNLFFRLYQKYKKDNSMDVWKRLTSLPKHIILLFAILIASVVVSFVLQSKVENKIICFIPITFELISTIVLGFTSENYFIDNSPQDIDDYTNDCISMYKKIFEKRIKSKDQLHIFLDRANNEVNKLQAIIDEKQNELKQLNQILIIPIILIILKALWDSTLNIAVLLDVALSIIIVYLAVYAIIVVAIKAMNFDIVRREKLLQSFADDLQGIIDVIITFNCAENLQLPNNEIENTDIATNQNNE